MSMQQMERQLGYSLETLHDQNASKRCYSNLAPVPIDIYSRTEEELRTRLDARDSRHTTTLNEEFLPLHSEQVIVYEEATLQLRRVSSINFFCITVDIRYSFDLELFLLLSLVEATTIMRCAKLRAIPDNDAGRLTRLPKEIRELIYRYALPSGRFIADYSEGSSDLFLEGLGDSAGFWYPTGIHALLAANKTIRTEALPLAFQRSTFRLEDIDEVLRFLLGSGRICRDNVESLHFCWRSNSSLENSPSCFSCGSSTTWSIPGLHVQELLIILRQCKRLRSLSISLDFEPDTTSSAHYKIDGALVEIAALPTLESVEFYDAATESRVDSAIVLGEQ